MIRINLLPHRAEKRRAKQIQFIGLGVISFVIGALLVGFVHVAIETQISYQERRNDYLKKETAILDKQIDEIKKLREQTQSLLARKNVVENSPWLNSPALIEIRGSTTAGGRVSEFTLTFNLTKQQDSGTAMQTKPAGKTG